LSAELDGTQLCRLSDNRWQLASPGMVVQFALVEGRFELRHGPAVSGDQLSQLTDAFSCDWNGEPISAATAVWTGMRVEAALDHATDAATLRAEVALESSVGLAVELSVQAFPGLPLMRLTTSFHNASGESAALAQPALAVLGQRVLDGLTRLNWMRGAQLSSGTWQLQQSELSEPSDMVFDSHEEFGAEPGQGKLLDWNETSTTYIPWFAMLTADESEGLAFSFDYFGRWQVGCRVAGSMAQLSFQLPGFDLEMTPGDSWSSPPYVVTRFSGHLENMTDILLEWQYRYLWQYTRSPWASSLRMAGDWYPGSQISGTWDEAVCRQHAFRAGQLLASAGAEVFWRDYGWWNNPGDWLGPDWESTRLFLAKYGLDQLIYLIAYNANHDAAIVEAHPDWFGPIPGIGSFYAEKLLDLGNPDAADWMTNLLLAKAEEWGAFQWRNDSVMIGAIPNSVQSKQDAQYRQAVRSFLDRRPDCAMHGVNSGGREIGFDFVSLCAGVTFTDFIGVDEQYDAARLFPTDKLSGEAVTLAELDTFGRSLLVFNPNLGLDDAADSELGAARELHATYRYLRENRLAGRWVRQHHPTSKEHPRGWFQRTSWARDRALLVFTGSTWDGTTTVYPRGLDPAATYSVDTAAASGPLTTRAGADLMSAGITLSGLSTGELVFLGLPAYPGSCTGQHPAPHRVLTNAAVNLDVAGIEVRWTTAAELTHEVLRDGAVIATVAQGSFWFDSSPHADPASVYAVRSVCPAGHTSTASEQANAVTGRVPRSILELARGDFSGSWLEDPASSGAFLGGACADRTQCWSSSVDFAAQQDQSGWAYLAGDGPTLTLIAECFAGLFWRHPAGLIRPSVFEPAAGRRLAKRWFASSNDANLVAATATNLGTVPARLVIRIGDELQWQSELQPGEVGSPPPELRVSRGTDILFEVTSLSEDERARVAWDPHLHACELDSTLLSSATWAISGAEVAIYARRQPGAGVMAIELDGRETEFVDLFSPATTEALCVYRRRWDEAAPHQIRVAARTSDAGWSCIQLEALVVDKDASVQRITPDGLELSGPGWARRRDRVKSASAGDSIHLQITGERIRILGARGPKGARIDVRVDGVLEPRVDTYGWRGEVATCQVLFDRSWPEPGAHELSLTVCSPHPLRPEANTLVLTGVHVD